jgi:hypothetical protein
MSAYDKYCCKTILDLKNTRLDSIIAREVVLAEFCNYIGMNENCRRALLMSEDD